MLLNKITMQNLFPPEIIENSTESLFAKRTTKSKIIYLTVILALAVTAGLLPFITMPVTTQAQGVIRTQGENNILQAAVVGKVQQITISENSYVNAGDTIIVLNTDNIDEQITTYTHKISENTLFITDLENMLAWRAEQVQTTTYKAQHAYYLAKVSESTQRVDYLKREFKTSEGLFNKGVVSKNEYLQKKSDYNSAMLAEKQLVNQFRNNWQADITRLQQEITDITSKNKQLQQEKAKYIITAPISGAILNFSGIQVDNFISPGQTIAYISPNGGIIAECYVSPADIGFIRDKQKVNFQLQAYDYNQWGMVQGIVTEISNDVININNSYAFRVRCSLNANFLQLKNGYKGELKKGMTLTGRFYLTDRTLWQLLFDKVDDWMNPKVMKVAS